MEYGNIYSDVRKVNVTRSGAPIQLVLSHVISPYYKTPPGGTCQQTNMPESRHLKVVKIKSERLSRFWGRPMYVAAIIILPQGYDDHPMDRYPVIVIMDHYPRAYRFDGRVPTSRHILSIQGGRRKFFFQVVVGGLTVHGSSSFSR